MASRRQTKFDTLVAVFERLHSDLAEVPDPFATTLCENWRAWKVQCLNTALEVKRSDLTRGLEQGLREMPLLFHSLAPEHRPMASKAYHAALESNYPAFLGMERERLAKVLTRGRISGESECYLVRHAIDIGERGGTDANNLRQLYRLVNDFEFKGRRGA
jgi:hypothetical protein